MFNVPPLAVDGCNGFWVANPPPVPASLPWIFGALPLPPPPPLLVLPPQAESARSAPAVAAVTRRVVGSARFMLVPSPHPVCRQPVAARASDRKSDVADTTAGATTDIEARCRGDLRSRGHRLATALESEDTAGFRDSRSVRDRCHASGVSVSRSSRS